ncbi:DUF29 domain-containing protein [Tumidithrix helvetica PCC 7403]|uniref:DUF29 domain-containing protein n=1 Tax=Tumidithrix helvetica TaxID=3457545 RepID=UPI003C8A88C5
MTQSISPPVTGYESDLNLWIEETVLRLKARDFEGLDIDNLIEELEGLAGRDRRELRTRLTTLLEHILKRCYVNSEYDYAGWQATIVRTRIEIEGILEQSPSLKNYANSPELFQKAFKDALRLVRAELGYKSVQFPDAWQFSQDIDAILNVDFWE